MEHPSVPSNVRCCSPALQHPTPGGGGVGGLSGEQINAQTKNAGMKKGSRRLQVEKELNNLKKKNM